MDVPHDHTHEESHFYAPPGLNRPAITLANSGLTWSGAMQQILEWEATKRKPVVFDRSGRCLG